MKLSELTPELFSKALALYLERAYPGMQPPQKARIDTSALKTSDDVLALFVAEPRPNPGGLRVLPGGRADDDDDDKGPDGRWLN